MKIEYASRHKYQFTELHIGDVFIINDEFFMKTDEIEECGDFAKLGVNAVNIRTGILCYCSEDHVVEPVEGKFIVENWRYDY